MVFSNTRADCQRAGSKGLRHWAFMGRQVSWCFEPCARVLSPLRHIAFKPAQYLSGDSSLQHGIAAHSHQSVPRDMGRQRLCDSSRKNRDEGWLQKLL